MGGAAATAAASSAAATAAGGAFSEFRAGDPAAVDPFAPPWGGGFACPGLTGGAAGAATVVGCEAAAAGAASPGKIDSTLEPCEKPPAASLAPAGQPQQPAFAKGWPDLSAQPPWSRQWSLIIALLVAPRRDLRVPGFGAVRP